MIKKATLQNAKELFNLESSVFSKDDFGLSLASFYYHIKKNPLYIYIKDDTIIGYILWLGRKNHSRLYSLCIDGNYRGLGVAQKLLDFSFEQLPLKNYTLEVKITNINAVKLYIKNDFKIVKVLKNYYQMNVDGYLMKRVLP